MNLRPISIEFTGPPCSGKTTLIHGLAQALTDKGYKVKIMQEDAELVPKSIPKKTWERNSWITFGQLQSLIEIPYSDADVVLLDRGFYDALFWCKFLKTQNACSEEQSNSMYNILQELNNTFKFVPDWLFIIDVSVEQSVKRRHSAGGNIVLTTNEFVTVYKDNLDDFYSGITSSNYYLDTTGLTISEVEENVLSHVLQILKST